METEIVMLDSIKAYNELNGLPTLHPLVTVADLGKATHTNAAGAVRYNYGVYALFIKHGATCSIRYGMQDYDYQEGSVVSFAPGQTVQITTRDNEVRPTGVMGLLFHPDLIYGTSLAQKIDSYTFFNYDQTEALHLSKQEQKSLIDCLHNIEREMRNPVDRHSRELLCMHIELFLEYCMRYYDRQFLTRAKVNSDVLQRFESDLNAFLSRAGEGLTELPSVKYFAGKACLSPSYFGDLIKKETGKTAQEYIQMKLIGKAKQFLHGSRLSVSQIADMMGFQYPQHFIRLFKKQTGLTPGEYRQSVDN